MPNHALSAKAGLKKALRQISNRVAPLTVGGGLSMPRPLQVSLPRSLPFAMPAARRRPAAPVPRPLPGPHLDEVLSIPVIETNAEDAAADTAISEGQFLARQDRWEQLEARIIAADDAGQATPGGTPIAELIAFGARADVLNAFDHALSAGVALCDKVTLDGIMSLERMRLECDRAPTLSTLVALAHLDIARACGRLAGRSPLQRRASLHMRAAAHHARANAVLSQIPELAPRGTFQQAARCALHAGGTGTGISQIVEDHIALIRLDPRNPRRLRALGSALAEQGQQGLAALDQVARRAAALTQAQWGEAGYTWTFFDVLARCDAACALVDRQLFLDGLADIVARSADQDRINLLAAYCCVSLKPAPAAAPQADRLRAEIAEAAHWLVRGHLREIHPMIWAKAAHGFDTDSQANAPRKIAERGRADAFRAIARLFRDEIEAGCRVVFTGEGAQVTQS